MPRNRILCNSDSFAVDRAPSTAKECHANRRLIALLAMRRFKALRAAVQ
jgi:hypothetical protein